MEAGHTLPLLGVLSSIPNCKQSLRASEHLHHGAIPLPEGQTPQFSFLLETDRACLRSIAVGTHKTAWVGPGLSVRSEA